MEKIIARPPSIIPTSNAVNFSFTTRRSVQPGRESIVRRYDCNEYIKDYYPENYEDFVAKFNSTSDNFNGDSTGSLRFRKQVLLEDPGKGPVRREGLTRREDTFLDLGEDLREGPVRDQEGPVRDQEGPPEGSTVDTDSKSPREEQEGLLEEPEGSVVDTGSKSPGKDLGEGSGGEPEGPVVETGKNKKKPDYSFYSKLKEEEIQTLKNKFLERRSEVLETKEFSEFSSLLEYDEKSSLEDMHDKYNSFYDKFMINEDIKEFQIIYTLILLVFETIVRRFFTMINVDGIFEFFRRYKEDTRNYIDKYCTDKYLYEKKNNNFNIPDTLNFYHNDTLVSVSTTNKPTVVFEFDDKPSFYDFMYNIFINIMSKVFIFAIEKFAKDILQEQNIASISNWINEFTKRFIKEESRVTGAHLPVENINSIMPMSERRMTTNILGCDVLNIIENWSGTAISFLSNNSKPKEETLAVRNRRTPRVRKI